MNRIKLVFWLMVMILAGIMLYQNRGFLLAQNNVGVNFGWHTYSLTTWNAVYLLTCFLAGVLVSYFFSLSHRFKTRKSTRRLSEELAAQKSRAADLEAKLAGREGRRDMPEQPE